MELINNTDFPPFPEKVGNIFLNRILISQAPFGHDEPCNYDFGRCAHSKPFV